MGKLFLRVTMNNWSKWDIPADIIAKERAKYYAELDSKDGNRSYDEIYEEEFNLAMSDGYLICEWGSNNMNWQDVEKFAVKVEDCKIDFQESWINGDKEIIEK